MKICFKRVEINNFLSIGHAKVELDDRGYVLVNGINNCNKDNAKSNGSGKSAIYDSILWALTGTTSRGVKDVTNIFGDDGALVEVVFDVDDKEYRLIRSKNHSKYKTDLKIYINNEDKSGRGLRDSEKILEDVLPDLTVELLGGVILLGQGMPFRFTNNPPSKRKEILEQLSKSDFMIEDVKERVANRKFEIKTLKDEANNKLVAENTKLEYAISQVEANKKELEELQKIDNVDKEIEDCEKFISDKSIEIENNNKTISTYNEKKQKENELLIALLSRKLEDDKEVVEAQKQLDDKRSNGQRIATMAEEVKKQFTMLDSVVDICPTCKQKLPNVVKIDTSDLHKQYDELKVEFNKLKEDGSKISDFINQKKTAFDNAIKKESDEIKSRIRSIDELIRSAQSAIDIATRQIESKRAEMSKYTELKLNKEIKTKTLNNNIENLEKGMQNYKDCIDLYKNQLDDCIIREEILTKFESLVKRDFRGYLLIDVVAYIDKIAKMYSLDIFKTQDISIKINGNDIDVCYNEREYEALSGGERQKVDIIIQLAIRDMLKTFMNFSSNIIVFDEMFDFLDNVGANALVQSIANRLNDLSSIFIVTHHTDIDIPCDDTITVIKDESGVSRVL